MGCADRGILTKHIMATPRILLLVMLLLCLLSLGVMEEEEGQVQYAGGANGWGVADQSIASDGACDRQEPVGVGEGRVPLLVNWSEAGGKGSIQAIVEVGRSFVNETGLASIMPEDERLIFVGFGNLAFVPFFSSWICNTMGMEGIHRRTLIVFSDAQGEAELKERHPNFEGRIEHVLSSTKFDLSGPQNMPSMGFALLVAMRNEVVGALLQGGVDLVLFEADSTWVRNPLHSPDITKRDVDITAFINVISPPHIGLGLNTLRSTPATLQLWGSLETKHKSQLLSVLHHDHGEGWEQQVIASKWPVGYKGDDVLFREIAQKMQSEGRLRLHRLPRCLFPSGEWYDGGVTHRVEYKREGSEYRGLCQQFIAPNAPFVLQNNWIIGVESKRTRADRWGHWFEGTGGEACPDMKGALQTAKDSFVFLQPLHRRLVTECPMCGALQGYQHSPNEDVHW